MALAQKVSNSGFAMAVDAYVVPISVARANIGAGSEADTGFDLPADGVVLEMYLIVDTAEATGGTKTIDVGLLASESGGNADGFLDGVSCATPGIKLGTLVSGGQTKGVLMAADENGSGVLVPQPLNLATVTARSVSVTVGSNDWAEFAGRIVFLIARDPQKLY